MLEFQRLYPQYNVIADRRKQSVTVPFERRTGEERRSQDRVQLDTTLTRDIFEVKNKISQMQKTSPINFAQDVSKAPPSALNSDQFVKATKPSNNDNQPPKKSDPPSTTAIVGGILAVTLAGVLAGAFLGIGGAVVAVGLGAYIGGKALKQALVSHMTESAKNDMKNKKQ